jgi:hypothetical protein
MPDFCKQFICYDRLSRQIVNWPVTTDCQLTCHDRLSIDLSRQIVNWPLAMDCQLTCHDRLSTDLSSQIDMSRQIVNWPVRKFLTTDLTRQIVNWFFYPVFPVMNFFLWPYCNLVELVTDLITLNWPLHYFKSPLATVIFNMMLLLCASFGIFASLFLIIGLTIDCKPLLLPWIVTMALDVIVEASHFIYVISFQKVTWQNVIIIISTKSCFSGRLNSRSWQHSSLPLIFLLCY